MELLNSIKVLDELKIPPLNRLHLYREIARDNLVFLLMINIGSVLFGEIIMYIMLKWLTITKELL